MSLLVIETKTFEEQGVGERIIISYTVGVKS